MLRLYYDEANYFEVGQLDRTQWTLETMQEQYDNSSYTSALKYASSHIVAKPKAITLAELLGLSTATKLYLGPGYILPTRYSVRTYSSSGAYIFELSYDGIVIYNQRFYSDWESTSSTIYLMSVYTDEEATTGTDYMKHIKAFVNNRFELESAIADAATDSSIFTNIIEPEILNTPLAWTFVLLHDTGAQFEMYPYGAINNTKFATSAASIFNALFKSITSTRAIPCSKMTDKTGTTLYPSVCYDPRKWNRTLFDSTGLPAYQYDNRLSDKTSSWNDITLVTKNTSIAVEKSFGEYTALQEFVCRTSFVQIGDTFTDDPVNIFDVEKGATNNTLRGTRSWINDINYLLSSGTSYWTVLQLRDFNSLKNYAIKYAGSSDNLRIQSSTITDIPCVVLATSSYFYRTNESTEYNVYFVTGLDENIETNYITGQEILDLFFNSSDEVEDTYTPTTGAGTTIPGNTGGGGTSGESQTGGNGTWSDEGDDTTVGTGLDDDIAGVPSGVFGGLSNNNFLVHMNALQLEKLMSVLWDESFLDWLKTKLGRDLNAGVLQIKYGNLNIPTLSDVIVTEIAGFKMSESNYLNAHWVNQFVRYDFGSIEVPNYFGSFLDFEPYTQIELYLPKSQGAIQIPCTLVVGKKINVILTVDLSSGLGVYIIQNDDGTQIATTEVVVLEDLPYSDRNYTQGVDGTINNVGRVAQSTGKFMDAVTPEMVDDPLPPGVKGSAISSTAVSAEASVVAGAAVAAGAAIAVAVWKVNTSFNTTWNPGSASHMGGNNVAILKISRTYVEYPQNYTEQFGLPCSYYGQISECDGYFEISKFYPEFAAPADDLVDLETILQAGVYA